MFDRLRFPPTATLDLHPLRPSAAQAAERVRRWLQERQVMGLTEVLVITGAGRHSEGGASPVRTSVRAMLQRLARAGVVARVQEHTAGSVIVTLAPLHTRFDAPARHRDPRPPAPTPVRRLEGLSNAVLEPLEALAAARLERLGIRQPTPGQVVSEMGHLFSRLAGVHTPTETALIGAIERAAADLDDG